MKRHNASLLVPSQMEAQALDEPALALGLAVVSMDRAGVGLSDGMARGMSVRRWAVPRVVALRRGALPGAKWFLNAVTSCR